MSLHDKLRLHVAGTTTSWREDVPGALGAQTADGLLLAFQGGVTAATVIDAYNAARGAKVTLLYEGAVGDVARRSAARFGVILLDAASFPEPQPPAIPVTIAEALAPAPASAPAPLPAPAPSPAPPIPALPAPAHELLLPAHHEEPPAVAPAAALPPSPVLPWDATVPPADPFATAQVTLEVTPHEILAMPWTAHASEEEHLEVVETRRAPRGATIRPTTDLHPDARHWGLPWPRPVPPADAVAVADPRVWNNPARLGTLHKGFDSETTRLSVPAAPAPANEAANWLKKLQFDGVK